MASEQPSVATVLHLLQERLPDRFVRTSRKLTPGRIMGLLVCMIGFGRIGYRRVIAELGRGLESLFGWQDAESVPSPQAVGRSRRKMTREVCDQAWALVQQACPVAPEAQVRRYAGYRLVAIDATKLALPPTPRLLEEYGAPSNAQGVMPAPMAGLVQLWDVGANRPVGFTLTRCDFDERAEGTTLFTHLGTQDLLIGDRGYPSYAVFRALGRQRCRFLLRCSRTLCSEVTDFVASGATDAIVRLTKRVRGGGRCPGTPAIPVRLIRHDLPNGTTQVLATNLWAQRGHDRQALVDLYTSRWSIETAFREMKVFHALETFSASYPEGIYQEVVAIQIYLTLASELEAMARQMHRERTAEQEKRESPQAPAGGEPMPAGNEPMIDQEDHIRFNRLMISDSVVAILRVAHLGEEAVHKATQWSLRCIWKSRSKARPGRAYQRKTKRAPRGYKRSGD